MTAPAAFGILFSHASEMIWPDLVGRAYPSMQAARKYAESIAQVQCVEFAIMHRTVERPQWRQLGTGLSAHQVIDHRWARQAR